MSAWTALEETPRRAIVLAGLLALCLGWGAYLARPKPDAGAGAGDVRVWSVAPATIQRITYRDDTSQVVIEPRPPGGEEAAPSRPVWVTVTSLPPAKDPAAKEQAKQPDSTKPGSPKPAPPQSARPQPAPPSPLPPPEAFKGNARAEKLLETLATLEVARQVGSLARLDAAEFGFPSDSRYLLLELTGGAKPLRLSLGATAFGNEGRYALDDASGTVYLVRSAAFQPLERARGLLIERALAPFPVLGAARIVLKAKGRERSAWQLALPHAERDRWAWERGATRGDPALQELVQALQQLRVSRYLNEQEPPVAGRAAALVIELYREAEGAKPVRWRLHEPAPVKPTPAKPDVHSAAPPKPDGGEAPVETSFSDRPVLVPAAQVRDILTRATKALGSG